MATTKDNLQTETEKREQLQSDFEAYKKKAEDALAEMQRSAAREQSLMKIFNLVKMVRHYYLKGIRWYNFTKQCTKMRKDIAARLRTELDFGVCF